MIGEDQAYDLQQQIRAMADEIVRLDRLTELTVRLVDAENVCAKLLQSKSNEKDYPRKSARHPTQHKEWH